MTAPLLAVENLSIAVARGRKAPPLPIVHNMGFTLDKGGSLGIVGESGSGKSLLALALIGLLPPALIVSGQAFFDGQDLLTLDEGRWCTLRGRRIAMIFQEPLTALNPAMTIGAQIAEGLRLRAGLDRAAAAAEALRLINRVRIPDAARRLNAYPHELSGGQRQRVGIAMALTLGPDLLIADEPTTALDVTVQADILDLLSELTAETAMALILISHDLGVIARATAQVLVAYAGTRLETGATQGLFSHPRSPYTAGLIAAQPGRRQTARLPVLAGTVPSFAALPPGCRFAPRCGSRTAECEEAEPPWRDGLRCRHPLGGAG